MERGSVPSRTLLRGSITELEEEEDVDDVLPFRLTFFVFDSVTCGRSSAAVVTWDPRQGTVNQVAGCILLWKLDLSPPPGRTKPATELKAINLTTESLLPP